MTTTPRHPLNKRITDRRRHPEVVELLRARPEHLEPLDVERLAAAARAVQPHLAAAVEGWRRAALTLGKLARAMREGATLTRDDLTLTR